MKRNGDNTAYAVYSAALCYLAAGIRATKKATIFMIAF